MKKERYVNYPFWIRKIAIITILFTLVSFNSNSFADNQMNVPIYGQRWDSWSNDRLGTCYPETIGSHGCAISCIAMLFSFYGVDVNPQDMNNWLKQNGGYSNGCLVNWGVAAGVSGGRATWISRYDWQNVAADLDRINTEIKQGYPVIAEVRLNGYQHFVLITGYSGSTYYINDPWYGDSSTINDRYHSNPATGIYGVRIYHGTGSSNNSGGVYGTIHEGSATGSGLSGVTVTCGGQSTTSGSDGSYSLTGIPTEWQMLQFSKSGYESYEKGVYINAGEYTDAGHNYLVPISTSGGATYEKARHRLPPVIYSIDIPKTVYSNQSHTFSWTVMGYHETYDIIINVYDANYNKLATRQVSPYYRGAGQ